MITMMPVTMLMVPMMIVMTMILIVMTMILIMMMMMMLLSNMMITMTMMIDHDMDVPVLGDFRWHSWDEGTGEPGQSLGIW